MSYLLDTTAISEMMRPGPNAGLVDFLSAASDQSLFTSVLVIGEILFGLERLPETTRKRRLMSRFRELRESRFARVLPVDEKAAVLWASQAAEALGRGVAVPAIDGLVAATARARSLTVVTRNVRDFIAAGAKVLNPWT